MTVPQVNNTPNDLAARDVAVIGGGIIGICTAYYLHKAGKSVVVIDKDEIGKACSFGNAGYITPSHFIPLAAPGMIQKGLKWMLNPQSPFYVRPSLNIDFLKWLISFAKKCTQQHTLANQQAILDINLKSLELYQVLHQQAEFNFEFHQQGLLMLCKTQQGLNDEAKTVAAANKLGLQAKMLTPQALRKLEPNIQLDVMGASFYPEDAHIAPYEFILAMKNYLVAQGVEFRENTEITGFSTDTSKSTITAAATASGDIKALDFVLANGAWSPKLAKQLGLNLPVQSGKGICVSFDKPPVKEGAKLECRTPFILSEAKVAVSPLDNSIRFGGTMELGVLSSQEPVDISPNRIKGLIKSAARYLPDLDTAQVKSEEFWSGFRPCSPDGLPIIGKAPQLANLTIATGHAMMGLSLGPITGKLVSEIINKQKTSLDLTPFSPQRFG
ncbi:MULTISPECIES: FAD-binding oxidoreductase [unclassified Shewanella]|uniref:NAD(P)/FAD-dependent oxidoreductase n=1 Tax=unclassified Shewanella TaxID=196818 RepID=UPI001BC4D532|nr:MULTISPECIES: FAD-dependent oxidoreductase [unclassified Shewanella]GIU07313.1 amino acid dehydrogenase [Shewanella sp. MBTL60-112-B1]GIU35705.1 amino acid dehydrogenase [Shewanella sp. MBTL60-112-B2]